MVQPDAVFDPDSLEGRTQPVPDPYELKLAEIDADDLEEAVIAQIPLAGNPRKNDYLSHRSMGFSIRESCALAEITFRTLLRWRRDDPDFADFETNKLHLLQHSIASTTMRMRFMRNMSLALMRDSRVLKKAVYAGLHGLSEREYDYLKNIRKHYTPQDLIAVDKATAPEAVPTTEVHGNVNIYVDNRLVDTEDARRAAARQLLERFSVNKEVTEALGDSSD